MPTLRQTAGLYRLQERIGAAAGVRKRNVFANQLIRGEEMGKTRAEIANENTTEAHNKELGEKRLARLEARQKKLESENKSQAMENRSLRERVEILLQSVKGL